MRSPVDFLAATVLSALLCPVLPAAAQGQEYEEQLAAANSARSEGKYEEALILLEELRTQRPDDANVLRLIGTVQGYLQRYEQSIMTLERALGLAPEDLDIRAALAHSYLWSGMAGKAEEENAFILSVDPDNGEAAQISAQISNIREQASEPASADKKGAVSLTQSIARVELASGDQTWSVTTLSGYVNTGDKSLINASIARFARAPFKDESFQVGAETQLGENLRAGLSIAATPDSDFRPKWDYSGNITYRADAHFDLALQVRHSEFRSGNASSLAPGIVYRPGGGALAIDVKMLNLWDENNRHRVGVSGRADYYAGDILLFGGAATYPDTEAGVTRQLRSAFIGSSFPVTERIGGRIIAEYDDRENSYERIALVGGLTISF